VYLPVPVIRRELKVLPAITKGELAELTAIILESRNFT